MYPINLDQELAKKLEQGMRSAAAVDLPFPVTYVWTLNGQANLKSQGGALYYGGWACKADDLHTIAEQQGLPIPQDWKRVTISSRDGEEFDAYTVRHVIIAPIGKRMSWLSDGKRYSEYVDGGRRHLQVLAYMAESQGENGSRQYVPWGPVVLTSKGYQAGNMLEAFNQWDRATVSIRRKIAPGVPAWCFYLALGTFEKERHSVNVGKPGAQSPITPISAYIPEKLSEELISSLFVGNEIAAVMADLQDQAKDWLQAWDATNLDVEAQQIFDDDAGFQTSDDEIPF